MKVKDWQSILPRFLLLLESPLLQRHTSRLRLTIVIFGLGWVGTARAQLLNTYFPPDLPGSDVAQGVTVQSRSRPEYDFEGTRVGNVVIRPQLAESFGYNDNVLGQSSGVGSAILKTDTSVQASTDRSRNNINFFIGSENNRYLDLPNQNETNWRASLGGSLEIGRDIATLTYRHLSQHQDPGDIDSANFDRPLAYDVDDLRASYRVQFPRFSLTPTVELLSYRFSPGSFMNIIVPEKGRDRDTLQEEITARYEVTPQDVFVGVVRPVQTHYVSVVGGVRQPSSTGVSVLGGFDYLGESAVRYRALVGYTTRSYANTFSTHAGPVVEASGTWSPTGLTTFTGTVSRSIEDAGEEDSAGYTYSQAKLSVDHEYRRNILLKGYIGLQEADYLQSNRTEIHYQTGLGAIWFLNRYVRLAATYDFVDSNSSGSALKTFTNPTGVTSNSANYTRNIFLLRLEFGRFDPSYK